MPYVLMRRTDIPNGVLQIDDLKPNDSQRNYVLDPPGQSGYVQNIPENTTVVTAAPGAIVIVGDTCGLGGYLIDNVADASGAAILAAVANTASAAIIARVRTGQSITLADIDAILVASGATALTGLETAPSTGSLAEVLMLLSGAKYQLPNGSVVDTNGATFNPIRQGYFATTPGVKTLIATGAFNISNGAGDLFNFKKLTFEYSGAFGPAILVLADDGTVL